MVAQLEPHTVIVDPVSTFTASGTGADAQSMLLRLVDFLKARQTTALFTHLTPGGAAAEATDIGVSSLVDTWLLVRNLERDGKRSRGLYVLKSRGMAHSNQIHELQIASAGVTLKNLSASAKRKRGKS